MEKWRNGEMIPMNTVYLFLAEGFETIEALAVVDVLRRADVAVKTVSVSGSLLVASSHHILVTADFLFDELDFTDADMLVLPGGMPGTLRLREHAALKNLLVQKYAAGKIIGAICAAPTVLFDCGLLDGKTAACHFSVADELASKAKIANENVATDGNLITSKGAGCTLEFAFTLAERLTDLKTVQTIKKAMCVE